MSSGEVGLAVRHDWLGIATVEVIWHLKPHPPELIDQRSKVEVFNLATISQQAKEFFSWIGNTHKGYSLHNDGFC